MTAPGPCDPIAAATHPDPYPYYAALAARPLAHDAGLGMWVAASPEAVGAVLASPRCAVRPPDEPVPAALAGAPAGALFRRLIRMNDGERQRSIKRAVAAALASIDPARAASESAAQARWLADSLDLAVEPGPVGLDLAAEPGRVGLELAAGLGRVGLDLAAEPARVSAFLLALPVQVVGRLLGLPRPDLAWVAGAVDEVAACFAPGAAGEVVERGNRAAFGLESRFRALLADPAAAGTLSDTLARQARAAGAAADEVIANAIGCMTQAHEATAGLLGNTLVALGRDPAPLARVRADPPHLAAVVDRVLRADPPVQNTRRFVVDGGPVAGQTLRRGDTILVLLAAAGGRAATPAAGERAASPSCFGAAAHACPGAALSAAIAAAGVQALLAAGVDPPRLLPGLRYRPSVNLRVPCFDRPRAGGMP